MKMNTMKKDVERMLAVEIKGPGALLDPFSPNRNELNKTEIQRLQPKDPLSEKKKQMIEDAQFISKFSHRNSILQADNECFLCL